MISSILVKSFSELCLGSFSSSIWNGFYSYFLEDGDIKEESEIRRLLSCSCCLIYFSSEAAMAYWTSLSEKEEDLTDPSDSSDLFLGPFSLSRTYGSDT